MVYLVKENKKLFIGWLAAIVGYLVNFSILMGEFKHSSRDIGDSMFFYSIIIGSLSAIYSFLIWRNNRTKKTTLLVIMSSLLLIPVVIFIFVFSMFALSAR